MTLSEAILVRKSIRSYRMEPLDAGTLDGLVDFLSDLEVPYASIDWNFDILPYDDMCELVGGVPVLKAPHYLVIRSVKLKGCLQNAGYIGEMAVLYLTTLGIGTCWQGGLECENDFPESLPYITAVAFGPTDEPFRDQDKPADRKSLTIIAAGDLKGPLGQMLESARLAPSYMGRQPCRFTALNSRINIYRKKDFIRFPHITYQQCVDVGAAIAHIYVTAKVLGYVMKVEIQDPAPEWNKNIYQATIHLSSDD